VGFVGAPLPLAAPLAAPRPSPIRAAPVESLACSWKPARVLAYAAAQVFCHPHIAYVGADLSKVSLDDALLGNGRKGGQQGQQQGQQQQQQGAKAVPVSGVSSTTTAAALAPAAPDGSGSKQGPPVFDPAARTMFTAEGLTYYLPLPAVHNLLACISKLAAPGVMGVAQPPLTQHWSGMPASRWRGAASCCCACSAQLPAWVAPHFTHRHAPGAAALTRTIRRQRGRL